MTNLSQLAVTMFHDDTNAKYLSAMFQYTVDPKFINDLTEEYYHIYKMILGKVVRSEFKGYIEGFLNSENSGMWARNKESPFYDEGPRYIMLNTFNNFSLHGKLVKDYLTDKKVISPIYTSLITFFKRPTKNEIGWVFTVSKSLYAWIPKEETVDMFDINEEDDDTQPVDLEDEAIDLENDDI